jgi:hypothetical protein
VELGKTKKANYDIEICYLFISFEESVTGVLKRYYKELLNGNPNPRYVNVEYILKKAQTFDKAVVKCLDYTNKVSVINRKGDILVDFTQTCWHKDENVRKFTALRELENIRNHYISEPNWEDIEKIIQENESLANEKEKIEEIKEFVKRLNSNSPQNNPKAFS